MQQLVVISGCSGGGKSALLEELRRRGHASVDEPGRRIITEQMRQGGDVLPWADMAAFLHEALQVARLDIERVALATGPVFFDRGLVDAAAALQRLFGVPMSQTLGDFRPYGLLVLSRRPGLRSIAPTSRDGMASKRPWPNTRTWKPPARTSATTSCCFRKPASSTGLTSFWKRSIEAKGQRQYVLGLTERTLTRVQHRLSGSFR